MIKWKCLRANVNQKWYLIIWWALFLSQINTFFVIKENWEEKFYDSQQTFAGIIHLSTKAVAVDMNGKKIYNNDDDSFMHISLPI